MDYTPGVFTVRNRSSVEQARNFPQGWRGKLVCDDSSRYKACFELGVTEIVCMAHARRKFFERQATNESTLAEQALRHLNDGAVSIDNN